MRYIHPRFISSISPYSYFQKQKEDQKLNDPQTLEDILLEVDRLEIREKAPFIAAHCLFTVNILKELADYKLLFNKVTLLITNAYDLSRIASALAVLEKCKRSTLFPECSGKLVCRTKGNSRENLQYEDNVKGIDGII